MRSLSFTILLLEIAWTISDGRLLVSLNPSEKSITFEENKDLNLTCRISGHESTENYSLSWTLPRKINFYDRVTVYKTPTELTVTIRKLQEDDSGQYVCEVKGGGIIRRRKIAVLVKSGKVKCMKHFFLCGNGMCIPQHYVCDGHTDCPGGNDESKILCGDDPCVGKFLCNGRCIPRKLCCDPFVEVNCSVNYIMPCCERLLHHDEDVESSSLPDLESQYGDIYFIQCTIYIIIGCAVLFILITTILAVLICRIEARHTVQIPHHDRLRSMQNLWPWHPAHVDRGRTYLRSSPAGNVYTQMPSCHQRNVNQISESYREDPLENFVLLTYGSHGFELADSIPKPPTYTEAVDHIGQPPPPYASNKNLAEDETESQQRLIRNEHASSVAQGEEGC